MRLHGRWCTRADTGPAGDRRRAGEGGFSLVELIVVLLIVAVITATASLYLGSTRAKTSGPNANAAAGAVWRGINHYRLENNGLMPAAALLAGGGAGLVNPGTGRYVERWPLDATGTAPLVVTPSGAGAPPVQVPRSPSGTYLYSSNGATGWFAGYGPTGRLVYRRVIGTSTDTIAPTG